jgi:hypothetical protein
MKLTINLILKFIKHFELLRICKDKKLQINKISQTGHKMIWLKNNKVH